MNKQEKNQKVDELTAILNENKNFYLADTSTITGIKINAFRRICYEKEHKCFRCEEHPSPKSHGKIVQCRSFCSIA